MLPNNLKDNDSGFANSATDSRIKLNAIIIGAAIMPGPLKDGAIGCKVNSAINPPTPLL